MLVTGALGAIGAAAARLCVALGAHLVLTDLGSDEALSALAQEIGAVDSVHRCDSGDRAAVERIVNQAQPLSALIDTAGICPFDDDWMDADWNETAFLRVMRTNVLGPINFARAVFPDMIERRYGRIALCGSIAGWSGGLRAGPHYAASKGAVHAFVRWLSQRGVGHGVAVNAVAPGPVASGMTQGQGYDPTGYPMGRIGQPDEIARMLVFLASPAASYASGAVFDLNGGTLLR